MSPPLPPPSSATTGFFQTPPTVPPQYENAAPNSSHTSPPQAKPGGGSTTNGDAALRCIVDLYLPQPLPAGIATDLSAFARTAVSPAVLGLAAAAETFPPTHHPLDSFGT